MRSINLSNDKQRDALVGYEAGSIEKKIRYVLQDKSEKNNVKILKVAPGRDLETLLSQHTADELSRVLVREDVDVDVEKTGMFLTDTKRVYLNDKGNIIYSVTLQEKICNPDASVKETRPHTPTESNVAGELPLIWTGKLVPKDQAIRSFVFARKYQIKHINGLTYDFLFDMAKTLHEKKSLTLIGAGKKGAEPLIFSFGGVPYRGFLEGRISGDTYMLILHLSNMELKGATQ